MRQQGINALYLIPHRKNQRNSYAQATVLRISWRSWTQRYEDSRCEYGFCEPSTPRLAGFAAISSMALPPY